jgi:hypothetical protein
MTTDAPTGLPGKAAPPRPLEIHVLNGGYGESIVVHLPDDTWGVVDVYTADLDDPHNNPTVQFLEAQGVTELEFLCLTHPHADHFRGMSHLLQRFKKIRYFWRFPGLCPDEMLVLYLHGDDEQFLDTWVTKDAAELRDVLRQVRQRRKRRGKNKLKVKHGGLRKELYPEGSVTGQAGPALEIVGLAPCDDCAEAYKEKLASCFDEDGRLMENSDEQLPHNEISLGLLIRYGTTRVILGGDVERQNWQQALLEWPDRADLAAHGVKVSHHGSKTGYCKGLWAAFGAETRPVAVITPSICHRRPNPDAVTHIRKYASQILVTSAPATARTLGLNDLIAAFGLKAGAALHQKLKKVRLRSAQPVGRCTLTFDFLGHVTARCIGAAAALV